MGHNVVHVHIEGFFAAEIAAKQIVSKTEDGLDGQHYIFIAIANAFTATWILRQTVDVGAESPPLSETSVTEVTHVLRSLLQKAVHEADAGDRARILQFDWILREACQ